MQYKDLYIIILYYRLYLNTGQNLEASPRPICLSVFSQLTKAESK